MSTPEGRPNSDTHAAACRRWSDDNSREGDTSRDVIGQGPRAFRSRFRPPPRRPLASVDLPQPVRPGHPVSQIRVGRRVEIATTNAHAVTWARKNGPARRSVRYAQRAVRAALHASSRKKRVRSCTQGAFHRRAREQFRKIARSASGPHGCPRGPAVGVAFVSPAFRSVDLLRAAWARPRGFPTHEAPGIRSRSQQPRRLLRLVRPAG